MVEGHLAFFPYKRRPIQDSMMGPMVRTLEKGGHIVIEAGTGAGKTVSALAPALWYAYKNGKRVLYLTRTNSQQKQVVEEFRKIRTKVKKGRAGKKAPPPEREDVVGEVLKELNRELVGGPSVEVRRAGCGAAEMGPERGPWEGGPSKAVCAAIQGRSNMCPLASEDPEFLTGTPEELSKMCSERKKRTNERMLGRPSGGAECRFYSAFLMDDGMEVRRWAREDNPTAEGLSSRCLSMGICPYEVTKMMVSEAVLVTAPYIFFLSPYIRRRLLEWMECPVEDLVIVIDEAHNLAQYARELSTISLSTTTLRYARNEVEGLGDHVLGDRTTIKGFIDAMAAAIEAMAEEFLIDEDGLVPPTALTESLMSQFRTNSNVIDRMASEMQKHGSAIEESKKAQGKLPRSYIHRVATFYMVWAELGFESYSPLIVKGRRQGELSLEAYAMDPSIITKHLLDAHATVHMSGTLAPLEEYRDSIGLPEDVELLRLPPPFPASNREVVYDREVSTNFELLAKDPEMRTKLKDRILRIMSLTNDLNTAVYFPSFDLMSGILGMEELEDGSMLAPTGAEWRRVFVEGRGSSQTEVMELVENFKESKGGVLASVIGGRLSEGLDFPGRSLEIVLIVGVPYPKPTARQRALSSYYDMRFGKGWEYTVHAPAARRMLQAIGRMIRSPEERGFACILDKRAVHFGSEIIGLRPAREDLQDIRSFFDRKG